MTNKFDWGTIKSYILPACENAYTEQGLNIDRSKINKALVVFKNILDLEVPYLQIRDFGKRQKAGLQECYIENLGNANSLLSLASSIESFLKVLLIQSGLKQYNEINTSDKTLKPLAEFTGAFGSSVPPLNRLDIKTLNNKPNGLYLLGCTYEARNSDVHTTPGWDIAKVMNYLKHIIAFEIYCIIHLYSNLISLHPELAEVYEDNLPSNDLQAYDLIAFGKSAGEYKSKVLQASIIHLLNQGEHNETEIIQLTSQNFGSCTQSGVKKAIYRLKQDNKIEITEAPKYGLTDSEKNRILKIKEDFVNNRRLLKEDISNCVKDTTLEGFEEQLIEGLSNFWDAYLLSNGNHELTDDFDFKESDLGKLIFARTNSWEDSLQLTKKLIQICEANDCLKRKSFGKACTHIISQKDFHIETRDRAVWFDTQIVLYLLAMPSPEFLAPLQPLFRNIQDLDKQILNKRNLKPAIGKIYLSEIVHHLKEALKLCMFETCPWFAHRTPSNNVFFNYYISALKDNCLPQGIETFSQYLETILNVSPEDLNEDDCDSILYNVVEDALYDKGIQIIHLPDTDKLYDTIKAFSKAITQNQLRPKSEVALKNDAIMGAYLFENTDVCSPIFVTLDKSFPPFRACYIESYKRNGLKDITTWQIYTPSKLVNQLELLNMEFCPESINDGILLILESDTLEQDMRNFLDVVIRLTSNKWTSNLVAKKRQEKLLSKFYHKEFENIGKDDEVNMEYTSQFVENWDKLVNHFDNIDGARKNNFFRTISEEAVFDAVVQFIDNHIKNDNRNFNDLLNQLSSYLNQRESSAS